MVDVTESEIRGLHIMSEEIKWIKINTDMFNDDKIRLIESMPEADSILIVWIKLLAQAGKTNASGYIFLNPNFPYNEEMLATIFNRKITTVRMALKVLKEFGMIDIDENDFIAVTNWTKHQNIEGMDKVKEQARLRQQKAREKKAQLKLGENNASRDSHVTVTQNHAIERDKELDIELEKEREIRQGRRLPDSELILSKDKGQKLGEFINNFEFEVLGLNAKGQQRKLSITQITSFNDLAADVLCYDFELMEKAKTITIRNQKKSYPYFESILLNWYDEGIKTMSDYERIKGRQEKRTTTADDYENA